MKVFIGLVLGTIAIGLLLVAAAAAFFVGVEESTSEGIVEDIGATDVNAFPQPDRLAVEISWTSLSRTATYVLQRRLDPQDDAWEDIASVESDSDLYQEGNSATYVDTDVEHLVTYHYRFAISTDDGGMGISPTFAVTAVQP